MEGKTLARIGAVVFVAVALTMGAIGLTQTVQPPNETAARQAEISKGDPLRAELLRCQRLGEAGPRDAACLLAWATSREKFLNSGEKSAARAFDQRQHTTTIYKLPPSTPGQSQQDEVQ